MPQFLVRHGLGRLPDLGSLGMGGDIAPEGEGALLVAHSHGERTIGAQQPRVRRRRAFVVEGLRQLPSDPGGIGCLPLGPLATNATTLSR